MTTNEERRAKQRAYARRSHERHRAERNAAQRARRQQLAPAERQQQLDARRAYRARIRAQQQAAVAPLTGPEIRARRLRLGLSLTACARRLGVTPDTLGRWERGEHGIAHPALLAARIAALEKELS